jgi:transcriptional regulator of acetoin/glycerol metabolism
MKQLGISRQTLYQKVREYDLERISRQQILGN